MTRNALGRGLSSLLEGDDLDQSLSQLSPGAGASVKISCDAIDTNPWQPRTSIEAAELEELAESIRAHGVLQPILLRPKSDGRFHLIAGERRLRASRLAGLKEVPSIVLDVDDIQVLAMALTENIQRSNLNPVEEAMGYQVLRDQFGLTQEEIAQRVGKPRSTIANFLRILSLPEDVREAVGSGEISMGHARALAGLSEEEDILLCLERVIRQGLNVRETERICKEIAEPEKKEEAPAKPKAAEDALDDDSRAVQDRLRERLGARVRLTMKNNGSGKIEIEFPDLGQLSRILNVLGVTIE